MKKWFEICLVAGVVSLGIFEWWTNHDWHASTEKIH
jgi:hypothetical protein